MAARYRLTPSAVQAEMMMEHCSHARFVWNLALEQTNFYDPRRGPTPSKYEQKRQLTEVRNCTWLGEGSSSVQQAAILDFHQAMKNWWAGTHGRPTWRVKGRHEGFVIRDLFVRKLNRKWATIHVPKLGHVKFRLSRPLPAEAKSARVTLDRSGRWHVSFAAPQPAFHREQTGAVIGLDLGVKRAVTTSDGNHLDMPTLVTPGEAQRKRRLQRQLARQVKGSKRRECTKRKIAKLSAREADRRKNWIEQTTTALVRDHDLIAIENLKVRSMLRSASGTVDAPGANVAQKRGLNRSISAQAWSTFRLRLEQKASAATSPCAIVAVNPANTSRRCNQCGHTEKQNRESQAVFVCRVCSHAANADVNAAINILAAGLAVTGRGGTSHERPDEASIRIPRL